MTDPDKTPLPVAGPTEHLDPAAMAVDENPCVHLYTLNDLYLSGHWSDKAGRCVDIHAGSGDRARQNVTLTPAEARQLAEDLIEMANAVDATREILAARESEEGEAAP